MSIADPVRCVVITTKGCRSGLRGAGAVAGGLRLRGAAGFDASLLVRVGAGAALSAFGAALASRLACAHAASSSKAHRMPLCPHT